jgi:hypothetical protein
MIPKSVSGFSHEIMRKIEVGLVASSHHWSISICGRQCRMAATALFKSQPMN